MAQRQLAEPQSMQVVEPAGRLPFRRGNVIPVVVLRVVPLAIQIAEVDLDVLRQLQRLGPLAPFRGVVSVLAIAGDRALGTIEYATILQDVCPDKQSQATEVSRAGRCVDAA